MTLVLLTSMLAQAIVPLNNPCIDSSANFSLMPWCNHLLPIDVRVADMVSRMTIAEKIAQLDTEAPAIASLGLAPYNWWSEATHGLSHVNNSRPTPASTNFAFPITTAAAFNRSLWRATGAAISREARAFMNAGHAYSTYWAPVVNLAREPRWGRNIECAGEDPYVAGEYATEFVTGFERLPEEPRYLAASACCKHYVANSMEDTRTAGIHHTRYSADPNITQRDLVDSYMAPFQACVEKGRVSSLMCSYNAVNGIPACANSWLLDTVARGAWGFDGYITSDCDAVANVVSPHRYVKTGEEAVAVTLGAGMDVDCSYFVGQHGMAALQQGLINESLVDERLKNLFRVRMRLQHFDPPGPLQDIPTDAICTAEAQAIARDGAAQGCVLVKNDARTLPLSAKAGDISSIAILGPNANLARKLAGYYGPSAVCGDRMPTMVDAIASFLPGAAVANMTGVPSVLSDDTRNVSAAAALARAADVTVLVLGTDTGVAMENRDAVDLTFSGGQLALLRAVCAASPRPVVVVTLTAVPLDLSPLLAHPRVGAVLHAGQPSINTPGVADVLFGVRSPAGRAVQTVYPAAYQDQVSPFDFNMRPGPSKWPRPDSPGPCTDPMVAPIVPNANCTLGTNPGRTYRFYNSKAVVPFGFGLSFSNWSYSLSSAPSALSLGGLRALLARTRERTGSTSFPKLSEAEAEAGAQPAGRYAVTVTNTGTVDADEVVLGFVAPPGAGTNGLPLKSLFGFERVHVKAGGSATVYLYPAMTAFTRTLLDGTRAALAGDWTVSFGVAETQEHGMGFMQVKLTVA
eukprot:g103.t1